MDGGEAGVFKFGECSTGVAEIIVQGGGIKMLDIIIIDEVEEGLLGVASGVEGGVGGKSNTNAAGGEHENRDESGFAPSEGSAVRFLFWGFLSWHTRIIIA